MPWYKINKKLKVIKQLQTIVGVGHRIAFQLVKKGVTSIKDLKQKINNKEIIVNNTIKLGIKYYGKFHGNIPRSEIDEINILINEIIASMNKQYNLTKHNKYIYEIIVKNLYLIFFCICINGIHWFLVFLRKIKNKKESY